MRCWIWHDDFIQPHCLWNPNSWRIINECKSSQQFWHVVDSFKCHSRWLCHCIGMIEMLTNSLHPCFPEHGQAPIHPHCLHPRRRMVCKGSTAFFAPTKAAETSTGATRPPFLMAEAPSADCAIRRPVIWTNSLPHSRIVQRRWASWWCNHSYLLRCSMSLSMSMPVLEMFVGESIPLATA